MREVSWAREGTKLIHSDSVLNSFEGNLALALTRYLISEKPFGDGVPKGLVLYSVSTEHFSLSKRLQVI